MSIKERARSHLPPMWERILDYFMRTANKNRLHERDWRIFYEFISHNGRKMSGVDLQKRLIAGGFSANYASEIICEYDVIRWCTRPLTTAEKSTLLKIKNPDAAI